MNKKRIFIVSIIAVIACASVFALTNRVLNVNSVNKMETNTSYTADQARCSGSGDWELNASWTNPLNKENVEITGNFIQITANTNNIDEINVDYNASLTYTGGTAEMNIGRKFVVLTLPLENTSFPFLPADFISDYVWETDLDTNSIKAYKLVNDDPNNRVLFAVIGFKDIKNITAAQDSDELVWELTENDTKIEVYNYKEFDSAQDFDITFTINYQVLPSLIVNYEHDMPNPFAPKVRLTFQFRCVPRL